MILALYIMVVAIIYAVKLESTWLIMLALVGYVTAEIRYSHLKERIEKLEKEKKDDPCD